VDLMAAVWFSPASRVESSTLYRQRGGGSAKVEGGPRIDTRSVPFFCEQEQRVEDGSLTGLRNQTLCRISMSGMPQDIDGAVFV
jgi:hypothetical protein